MITKLTPFQNVALQTWHSLGISGTRLLYVLYLSASEKLVMAQKQNEDLKALLREVGVDVD